MIQLFSHHHLLLVFLSACFIFHGGISFAKTKPRLKKTVRAFSRNEFQANYIRMTQYKRGQVPDCPRRIEITSIPDEIDQDLFIPHQTMRIGASNETAVNCTDDGYMQMIRSNNLVGARLTAFRNSILHDVYRTVLFDNLSISLRGKQYYVSIEDTPRTCGQQWFTDRETFIFFDENDIIDLTVVLKVENGIPRLLMLPLTGDIRYMVSVTTGSTCIYRVDSDVSDLLNNITRPSDSPSPTVSFIISNGSDLLKPFLFPLLTDSIFTSCSY